MQRKTYQEEIQVHFIMAMYQVSLNCREAMDGKFKLKILKDTASSSPITVARFSK